MDKSINTKSEVLGLEKQWRLRWCRFSTYCTLVLGRDQGVMTAAKERLNFQLLVVNAALAVAVLFSSGLIAALARPLSG